MRVAFLLQDLQLSGGVGVVVQHAVRLRRHHGIDARIVLTREETAPPWPHRGLDELPVLGLQEAERQDWDIALATWWETTAVLFHLPARRHAWFIQSLEDSLYKVGDPYRLGAQGATALPVRFITEARWIADLLEAYQPGNRVLYVRNGIDKEMFRSPEAVTPARDDAPLRVIVEGARGARTKGVDEALEVIAAMREPAEVTWVSPRREEPPDGVDHVLSGLSHAEMAKLLSQQHVMLKLSRVEGMYSPPLEAFHMGATVVTTPVTGHDEYVVHGVNGLIVGWDDVHGTARALDLLARDRRLLHELRVGALQTARAWPDWDQAARFMALALRRIAAEPPPPTAPAARRLMSDLASVIADGQEVSWRLTTEEKLAGQFRKQKAIRYALAARRQLERVRKARATVRAQAKRLLTSR